MKTVTDYIREIKEASDAEWARLKYTSPAPEYTMEAGSKYIRIVRTVFNSRSVHCFVDRDGNIYKAASWKIPAKGIRGNINDEKKPLLGWDYYNRR
jgi:hypothetical protein